MKTVCVTYVRVLAIISVLFSFVDGIAQTTTQGVTVSENGIVLSAIWPNTYALATNMPFMVAISNASDGVTELEGSTERDENHQAPD